MPTTTSDEPASYGSIVAPTEPTHIYDPSKGYITDVSQYRETEQPDSDGVPDDYFSEDEEEELFGDSDLGGAGGGGDLTKRYNRQREAAAGVHKGNSTAPAAAAKTTSARVSAFSKAAAKIQLFDHLPTGSSGNRSTDKSDRATSEQVLDPRTRMILLQLINRGHIAAINGVISTGKEANVYHALAGLDGGRHVAIKVYKTAILVFKDRDRYVTGEHRFRHGYAKSNPRQMVKLWAEKELRNLNRLHSAGLPAPEPLHLRLHVLVMAFVGDSKGWPAPRLRDAGITDAGEWDKVYLEMLAIMWRMYALCRLVHADLSEYNVLYHKRRLWVIDVSQSVELDHPRTFEFLRMDIKNVTNFFRKQGVVTVGMTKLFGFVTQTPIAEGTSEDEIMDVLAGLERQEGGEEERQEEEVFRQTYIPRTLEEVYDVERDAEMVGRGESGDLVYRELLAPAKPKPDAAAAAEESESDDGEANDDEDADDDSEDEDDESRFEKGTPRGNKHEDKEAKKERKKKVKEEKREARKTKMPKHMKKRLISTKKSK